MEIKKVIKNTQKPKLYEKGTAVMWTDEHISKQLLKVHLNEEIDLASRKPVSINKTVNWILGKVKDKRLKILDLGCGPGLYDVRFAKKGHAVTGVDFSGNSIVYARNEAAKRGLGIEYIHANYLELDLPENRFDLVVMIYTDFGVLLPGERDRLMGLVIKVLKPGGVFVFDVLNDKELEKKLTPKSWEAVDYGHWRPGPYVALSESFLYEKEKVILYQHTVFDAKNVDVYRFWTHFFSHADLKKLVEKAGFSEVAFDESVLPETDRFGGDNVTFCVAKK